jgi:hypothetical protein
MSEDMLPHPSQRKLGVQKAAKKVILLARMAKAAKKGASMFDAVRGAQANSLLSAAKASRDTATLPAVLMPIRPKHFSKTAIDDHKEAHKNAEAHKLKHDKLARKKQKREELKKRWTTLRRGSLLDEDLHETLSSLLSEEKPRHTNCKTCKEKLTIKEVRELDGICGKCLEEKTGFIATAHDDIEEKKKAKIAKEKLQQARDAAKSIGLKFESTPLRHIHAGVSKEERFAKMEEEYATRENIMERHKKHATEFQKSEDHKKKKRHAAHKLFKQEHYNKKLVSLARKHSAILAAAAKKESGPRNSALPQIAKRPSVPDEREVREMEFRNETAFALDGFESRIAAKRRDGEGTVLRLPPRL